MAELIISSFLTVLFDKLVSSAIEKLARFLGVESEMQNCQTALLEIRALLDDASHKEITDELIKDWLNRLRHLAYDIDDVLDELAYEAVHRELAEENRSLRSKVRKLIPIYSSKLNHITDRLQELEKEKVKLGLHVTKASPIRRRRNYETSFPDVDPILGRQGEKEVLLHKLVGGETSSNQNFSIVPIVGMGGVGKTTLARLLYNESQVKKHFELRAWVCVSDEFDIFKISKSILASLTGNDKEFADLSKLQEALGQLLMGKQFLLVLDDVWSDSDGDWDNLARPFHAGAPGSKVIMTTRKKELLSKLGYSHLDILQSLSYDDALKVFCQHALGVDNLDSHPTLRLHGEGIVRKCDGLPLALRALGRLLRTKADEADWKQLLNSEIWSLQKEDKIVPALILSYHDLSANLKQLFAYCSLFPKDYMFDKEELVLLWMAEGFLNQSTTRMSTEESLGREYFEELLSRSFFQPAPNEKSLFMMHDLINDLAISVAGDFFVRPDNEMQKDVKKDALEKHRHMSFPRERYMTYNKFKAFGGAKNLRTFLAVSVETMHREFYISNKMVVDMFVEFPLLRVLSLSCLEISEVPESIGSLKHLRYLNLCGTKIEFLPENVCNLYNLQTLILFGCKGLSKLPNNFSKLRNLRHFDVRDTPLLKKMPLGMGELRSLQTLSKIIIGGDNGILITELKHLKNLHGKISIKGLEKVENAMHASEANLSQKRLTELEVEWEGGAFDASRRETLEEEVLNALKPDGANLKRLGIVSYGGIGFPNWVGDLMYRQLTHVSIRGCERCTSLPPLEQLPSLKELFIKGMDAVKAVNLASAPLEIVSFEDMPGWEIWSSDSGVVDGAFPCLKELHLKNCPNLVELSFEALPSLGVLEIGGCGDGVLRSLVDVAPLVTNLNIRGIVGLSDESWRGVMKHLGAVEEVRIERCDEIRYLWESEAEAGKVLVNLWMLRIMYCNQLVSLGEKDEDNCGSNLTSLRLMLVWHCKSMKSCNCPNSIEMFSIYDCRSIQSVYLPSGVQKFKSLHIQDCDNLSEKELFIKPMVEDVGSCWSNLKSITDLSCFIHLERLTIDGCPRMESFPGHVLTMLTTLKYLRIRSCPSLDVSFAGGLWPPNLCLLQIGDLKKPILEWGPQNFPKSLLDLTLIGGSSDEAVTSSAQLSHLLPSSLTTLRLWNFKKLESLSMGQEHLTFLQHLDIYNCPKLVHLPEMLFPGLLELDIRCCPDLKEKCRKGGSYWHHISHIPNLFLDLELTRRHPKLGFASTYVCIQWKTTWVTKNLIGIVDDEREYAFELVSKASIYVE